MQRTRHADGMPAWIPRLIGMVVLAVLGTVGGLWVLIKLRGLLTTLLLALFISFALEPAVQYLARRGVRRGVATACVFLAALAGAAAFAAVTLPPLVSQTAGLAERLPVWLSGLSGWLDTRFGVQIDLAGLSGDALDLRAALDRYAATVASGVVGLGNALLRVLFQALTLLLFTFYLVADGPRVRRSVLSVIRPERQDTIAHIWEVAVAKTGGYVYSRGLLGLFSAVFTFVVLEVLGVPYSVPLSLWVGIFSQFLPAVGTYVAAVLPTLVALGVTPSRGIAVLAGLAGYQLIENYVLAPRITARTMSVHPAVAFGSVLAGVALLGWVGALIALPVAATIQALISTYGQFHDVTESTPPPTLAVRPHGPRRRFTSGAGRRRGAERPDIA